VQKDLGIVERLENIEHDIALVGADVKDVKAEVTKTLKASDLIRDLDKARTETEKEKIIILIKKYNFEELLDPAEVIDIANYFSGKKKMDIMFALTEYMRPTLTSEQYFEMIDPGMDMSYYGRLSLNLSQKLRKKLQFADYINHIKQIMQISDNEHRKLNRSLLHLIYLEEVTEEQKLQIAKTLNVDLSYLAHIF
jgi:hypothetical protein